MSSLKAGTFTIFSWNGKDLFIKDDKDNFTVLSHSELPKEFHRYANEWSGRQIEIYDTGEIELVRTREEIQERAEKQHRHLEILRDITGYENMGEGNLPEHAVKKLAALREELKEYEDVDPTATTMDQRRANLSLTWVNKQPKEKKIQ